MALHIAVVIHIIVLKVIPTYVTYASLLLGNGISYFDSQLLDRIEFNAIDADI